MVSPFCLVFDTLSWLATRHSSRCVHHLGPKRAPKPLVVPRRHLV
jgi:hypothetical protein